MSEFIKQCPLPFALYLEVENVSKSDFVLRARLICHGLLKMEEYLDVKGFDLLAGEKGMLQVPAGDVPIQITSGAAQARMELLLNEIKDGTEDTRQLRYLTPAINYRHGPQYQGLSIFDETALLQQHGGILAGVPADVKSFDEVIGRISDGKGVFTDVKLSDAAASNGTDAMVIGSMIVDEPPGKNTVPSALTGLTFRTSQRRYLANYL